MRSANVGRRAKSESDAAINAAVDAVALGFEPPPYSRADGTAMQVWAAEMVVHRAEFAGSSDDPIERDRVVREARAMWGVRPRRSGRHRGAKLVATALLGVLIVGSVVVVRSQSALPGDRLWTVKRWTEGARQWAAKGDVAEAERALDNTRERLGEAEVLIEAGRRQIARTVVFEFYREFDEVRFRLRDLSRERYPSLFDEADRQLAKAVEIDRRVSDGDVQQEAPVEPIVGTRSPTPRPPWLPASPEPSDGE